MYTTFVSFHYNVNPREIYNLTTTVHLTDVQLPHVKTSPDKKKGF
jgi:hypothetical protein